MEKVFLAGVCYKNKGQGSLSELQALTRTAGGSFAGAKVFMVERINSAFYIGSGQARLLAAECERAGARTVVFDVNLKANQQRNLEEVIPAKIIDRTRLILDIFARSAHSQDGKNQVELAQLEYILPRLTGRGVTLMQQVGGIGVRGPGEKQIEYDRRKIKKRMSLLKKKLKAMAERREIQRGRRLKSEIPIVAICGYTNSGKTTLLNALTKSNAVAQDRLFQTLDPLTRRTKIFDADVIFVDTVGFIRDIPPQLINAFHSTLEEISPASVLVVVLDVSTDGIAERRKVVDSTLKELGFDGIPKIFAANKCDKIPHPDEKMRFIRTSASAGLGDDSAPVAISALYKKGLEDLKNRIYMAITKAR